MFTWMMLPCGYSDGKVSLLVDMHIYMFQTSQYQISSIWIIIAKKNKWDVTQGPLALWTLYPMTPKILVSSRTAGKVRIPSVSFSFQQNLINVIVYISLLFLVNRVLLLLADILPLLSSSTCEDLLWSLPKLILLPINTIIISITWPGENENTCILWTNK